MDVIKISTDKCPKPGGWYSQAFRTGDLIFIEVFRLWVALDGLARRGDLGVHQFGVGVEHAVPVLDVGIWSAGKNGKFFLRYPFMASARSGAGLYPWK